MASLNDEITAACDRSGRVSNDVQLVAVTKYAEWKWVEALAQIHTVFGENRPQQLAERKPELPHVQWHLIGQLQRNKAKLAVQHAAMIHSVDSLKLLQRVSGVARELDVRRQVLLQVNVSGEASKSGFTPHELRNHWSEVVAENTAVEIAGLMTMAPASEDPDEARETFRGLSDLRNELSKDPATVATVTSLSHLSMGMSGDFAIAIEEGATIIRVGSRLFEGLSKSLDS